MIYISQTTDAKHTVNPDGLRRCCSHVLAYTYFYFFVRSVFNQPFKVISIIIYASRIDVAISDPSIKSMNLNALMRSVEREEWNRQKNGRKPRKKARINYWSLRFESKLNKIKRYQYCEIRMAEHAQVRPYNAYVIDKGEKNQHRIGNYSQINEAWQLRIKGIHFRFDCYQYWCYFCRLEIKKNES